MNVSLSGFKLLIVKQEKEVWKGQNTAEPAKILPD